jgi:flagellar protein FliL
LEHFFGKERGAMAGKGKVEDEEIDGDEAEGEGKEKKAKVKKPAGPMALVIVGAIALFVAVLGAQVAAPLLTKMIAGDPNAPAEEVSEDEELLALADVPAEEVAEESDEPIGPAIYVPLDPPFVVSFSDEGGGSRFLQLTLQAMARSEHTIEAVKTHAPAIRNSFLFLISAYKVEDLATLEGKEKLRAAMLVAANEIMEKNTGEPGIEELYFTSLVIQ